MGPYQAGTWFLFDDAEIGWQGKHRPCVLTLAYSAGPTARVRVRSTSTSTSSRRGIAQAAHPTAHESTCRIDADGWITPPPFALNIDLLDRYSCIEPDAVLISKLAGR